jgi:uncharacterized protein
MKIIHRAIFPELKAALQDDRVIVITGMRRVGKTTTLHWLLDQVESENKLYIDLERADRRIVFTELNYEIAYTYLINQGLNPDKPIVIALDEIQYVPNLPSVIKYLYDKYRIKFLLTGSSSYYLKNQFTQSLAGRKTVFEIFPLNFGEYLDFRGEPCRRRISFQDMLFDPNEFERLKGFYADFIQFGGLPNVVLEPKVEIKKEILADIYQSYIQIDVQSLADFRKLNELQKVIATLAARIGNKIDLTKISQIAGITRPTLNEYLEFLEKTYLIHRLPAFGGVEKRITLGKKLYFLDNGIANSLARVSEGALFENAVYNQLRGYGELAYYSKGNEYEIDFISPAEDHSAQGLEVKVHPTESDKRKLAKNSKKLGLSDFYLVGLYPTLGFSDFLWGGLIF